MGFLSKLPVVGPVVAAVQRSRPYRVFRHFSAVRGDRLAGAVTFYGFLALFPLLTVVLAVAVSTLTPSQVESLKHRIAEQVPGLADALGLDSLIANAATVGVISGLVLVVSGLGWVDTMRGSIREIWQLPEDGRNVVLRRLSDCLVLVGLGGVSIVSLGASVLATRLAGQLAGALGLAGSGPGHWLLAVAGFVIAVGSDLLLFLYLLAPFPGIEGQHRRDLLTAALIGAVGFEVLKLALSSYLGYVAGRSLYGAFGVPVALLLWINSLCRLLMYCVSWTAVADPEQASARALARAEAAYRAVVGPAPGR
ncbi:YihY/virulence factor BrkB family protein [Kitasatospora sp. RB6PN24]|uniref:YihY/virulence factor BrkB family protein n=1 Tax=Kitasatospora humi TaxID=2893891 RepID=UPI001E3EE60B|nr:YihY/virulence factor BrkB family protein [Kitasatospora humi]MCC9310514.1 YihY/virulence factor BrkB family protein [Kitasatospora humi]